MTVAYLVSEYPARSHTFIRREIEMMRERGFALQACSLHRCAESEILNEDERIAYDDTWSVFPIPIKAFIASHFSCLWRSPGRYFKALRSGFKYSGGSVKGFLYTFIYFAEAIYLAEKLSAQNTELIHVHFANSGAKVAAIAASYLEIPWMLSVHGTVDFEIPGILWLKDMAHSANAVRCISDFGAAQIKRLLCRSEYSKVFVAYCGLPSDYQKIPVKKASSGKRPFRLLAVGRLSSEKGQVLLLETAFKLKQHGLDFTLDLVGDGPDRAMLEEECQTLGLETMIHFHGAVGERAVFEHMRNAELFICSSFMEGLPQVLLESMLVGTPVIAPYIAGIPELISHRETGMLFPAGNTDALAAAILEMAKDKVLYEKVATAGRSRVLDHFMIDETIVPLSNQTRTLL